MDEDNYKEAIDASFKVFTPRGISEYMSISHDCFLFLKEAVVYIYVVKMA